jgi:predicted lactoylglutathione lyase
MANEYLDLLKSSPLATGADGTPPVSANPYLDMLREDEDRKRRAVAATANDAAGVNPDTYSAQRRVAKYLGYPVPAVEATPDESQREARVKEVTTAAGKSPVLARRYTDEDFAKLAHDDSITLGSIGDVVRGIGGTLLSGAARANTGAAGTLRAGAELIAPLLDPLAGTILPENPLRRMAAGLAKMGDSTDTLSKQVRPKVEGNLMQGAVAGGESFVQNALALPFLFFPGGQQAALTMMTAGAGGNAYQEARGKGLPMAQALPYAVSQGAIEYATEKLPLGALVKDLKAGSSFLKTLGRQVALEVPGEQIATILQDLNEWAVLNPEKPFSDYIRERPDAAVQTLVATIVGSGANVTLVKAIETAVNRGAENQQAAIRADESARSMQQLLALATQSKLRERSPEQFAATLQEMAEQTEGAPAQVFVDARTLGEVLQQAGITDQQLQDLLPSVIAQLPEAAATGGTVSIPIGELMSALPGSGLEQSLFQHIRTEEDGLSQVEAQQAAEQAQEFIKTEADRVMTQAADAEQVSKSATVVKDAIVEQLAATKRFSADVNEAYGVLVRDFFTALSGRLGVTPEQAFARYPLRVAAEGQGGLSQRGDQAANDEPANDMQVAAQRKFDQVMREAEFWLNANGMTADLANLPPDYAVDALDEIMAVGVGGFSPQAKEQGRALWDRVVKAQSQLRRSGGVTGRNDAGVLNQSVSTRVPTAKKAIENPLESMLVIGLEAAKADPKAFAKNIELVTTYPNYRDDPAATTPDAKGELFIGHAVDNLLWLFDQVPAETRERSKLWYDGARAIVDRWAPKYNLTDAQVSGVMAVLSPQKDWFQNVSLAERILDALANQRDTRWDDSMTATAAEILSKPQYAQDVAEITGKTLGELTSPVHKAMWIRVYDQTYNNRAFRLVTPEGDFGEWVVNMDGKTRSRAAWGSFNEMSKAVAIVEDGAIPNISDLLGAQHKVRNFYNNIFNPASEHGDVTIDTHAVAAALLRPLSGSSVEVTHNFGGTGSASSSITGAQGTYGIYAEAYRRAAAERGVLPREMQSITWEAVRGLFTAKFKAQAKNVAAVDAVWDNYHDGVSLDETRAQIVELSGGINPPEWQGSGDGASALTRDSTYAEDVSGLRVPGRGAEAVDGGTGAGASSGVAQADVLNQAARASFDPQRLLVVLNEGADLSSFLHESSHFFLEVLADVASQDGAPADVATDMATVLKWFGVESVEAWRAMSLDEQRPHHERFAEAFEQYLIEGRAPSQELKPLFQRFRSWMMSVYGSMKEFLAARATTPGGGPQGLQLSDEIRSVFDRLLASQRAIEEAQAVRGYTALFKSAEEAGMSPQEWAAYQAQGEAATADALDELQARSLAALGWATRARSRFIKRMQKDQSERRKGVQAEVAAEVDAQPVRQAMRWLRRGEMTGPDGEQIKAEKGFRLDTDALAEMYPEGMLARPDLTGLKGMTAKGHLHPDIVAEMFGYSTGDDLVRAILAAEPRDDVIEARTSEVMLERFGDLTDDASMALAADEAVHNEARARFVAAELKALSRSMKPVNVLAKAAREFADNLIARRKVKELAKSAPRGYSSAEARAAKAAEAAMAKGDLQAATIAKRDQLLNHHAVTAAQDARREMERALDRFRKIAATSDDRARGTRDLDVVNAVRAILAQYGIGARREKSALAYLEVLQKNDPTMHAALAPSVMNAIANAQPFEDMTVEQARALVEEINAMWYMAKRSRQMEIDGKLVDRAEAEAELAARIETLGVPVVMPGDFSAITPAEKRIGMLRSFIAAATRVESWVGAKDGSGQSGPFRRYIWQPVREAADRYRADKAKYLRKYRALLEPIASDLRRGTIAAPELGGYVFGKDQGGVGMSELLHAILHTGNESNKRKLLLGRGWASENEDGTLDTSKWDNFITRMHDTGVIGKRHYDFAQGVWDLLEETKPLAQKTHRDVFGKYFAEVTANAIDTPFGVYRGGYVPAQADARIVSDAATRALAETENAAMQFAFPATQRGFTKGRVEYNRPLLLDLRSLAQHIDKVLLFSHLEQPVRDVRKLLSAKPVATPLNKQDPAAFDGIITPWLNRAAKQQVETPIAGDGGLTRFFSVVRNRAGMAAMFANVANAVQQVTGFSLAAVKVPPRLMLSATAEWMKSPARFAQTVADASPYMATRMENEIAQANSDIRDILLDPGLYDRGQAWAQRHAYFLQSAIDNVMSPIVWTAAYNDALEKGASEEDARRRGDSVVRETQGTTAPEDVSRIETGNAFVRVFTQFVSYFNMQANLLGGGAVTISRELGLKKGAGRGLYLLMMGFAAPAIVGELVMQLFRGGPGDEDKDGEWLDDWLAALLVYAPLRNAAAMFPVAGQVGMGVVNAANNKPYDDRLATSPAVSMIESTIRAPISVYKSIVEEGSAQKATRDVATAISILTGIPVTAVARPLGYAAGIVDDKIAPTGPVDAARGAVTGIASPESKRP